MTRPNPANAITDETSGERWYILPDGNGGELRLLSVTTAFRVIAKVGLDIWKTEYTATSAFEELPTVITSSRRKPCGRTRHKCKDHDYITCPDKPCGDCRECVAIWLSTRHKEHSARRADEGTRVHDVIEWWSLHGEIRNHDQDVAPYVAAFKGFVEAYGLRPDSFLMCEATCVNKADLYAGTTDGIIRFEAAASTEAAKLVARVLRSNGEYGHLKTADAIVRNVAKDKRTVDLIVDWKTREGEGPKFYPDQALQIAGYRWAPTVRIKATEQFVDMPNTDGGVVIQLRPDGATARPVVCDEGTYEAFLNALRLFLWFAELGPQAISSHTFALTRKDAPATVEPVISAPAAASPPGCDCRPGDPCDEIRGHYSQGGYAVPDMPWHETGSNGVRLVWPASTSTKPDPFALIAAARGIRDGVLSLNDEVPF
jgi:hypothetical protein